jgi:hypothetical protein
MDASQVRISEVHMTKKYSGKNAIAVVAIGICSVLNTGLAHAAAWCELSSFSVDASENTGVFLNGLLAGQSASWIILCGTSSDCNSKATDRRLAIALSAQAQGKHLQLYFDSLANCASYVPYMTVTLLRVES